MNDEPECWLYERGRERVVLFERLRGGTLRGKPGWTETPLYSPEAAERIKSLLAENFMLAAGVCIYPNGEGLFGDDHGNSFCSVEAERKRLDERETELMAQLNEAEADRQRMREALEKIASGRIPGDPYAPTSMLVQARKMALTALSPASKEANDDHI